MSEARAVIAAPVRTARTEDYDPAFENPGRAFANALLLALPLWGLIGAAIWAIA